MKINNFVPNEAIFNDKVLKTNNEKINNDKSNPTQSFMDVFQKKLDEVNDSQVNAEITTKSFINGDDNIDIHQVMLASEEAKMSLQLAIQVRNKLVEGYQELNRMQL